MESKRQKQTAETIRRHFSSVLLSEGSYIYGSSFVTVTSVQVTPDISMAKIYLSIYNTPDKDGVIKKINDNVHHLKKNLAHRVRKHIRRVPEIAFYRDDTLDEMFKVDRLLNNLRANGGMGEEE
jgi:ribosome-binding factor A